jgi:hypothetical protein
VATGLVEYQEGVVGVARLWRSGRESTDNGLDLPKFVRFRCNAHTRGAAYTASIADNSRAYSPGTNLADHPAGFHLHLRGST